MDNLLRTSIITSVARYIDEINSLRLIHRTWYNNPGGVLKNNFPALVGRLTNKNEAQLSSKNKNSYFEICIVFNIAQNEFT